MGEQKKKPTSVSRKFQSLEDVDFKHLNQYSEHERDLIQNRSNEIEEFIIQFRLK
ncbi:hypothetical protein ACQW5G_01335 [Fructilactobacillus sp. Tb1]|uniref:hypothetical protein n=1 Tax=Fructilactobacillus sp. Tb1 TaxID=3422304 RepID=UPI003D2B3A11